MISARGLDLIKAHEGLRLDAYPDPASGGDPWTIGYGHTQGVEPGQRITQEQADAFLRDDVAWVEDAIDRHVKVSLSSAQYDALASLIFNIGAGAFASSTLLRKLNAGDYIGAGQEFVRWNKAAGAVMPGLTQRRLKEAALFASEAPIETRELPKEPRMAFPAILAALLPSLIDAVPRLATIFKPGSEVAERNVAAAGVAFDIAKKALSASNEQEVIERIKSDPAALTTVKQAIESGWFQLVEVGGGVEAARKADAQFTNQSGAKFYHSAVFWITIAVIPLVYISLYAVLFREGFSDAIKAMVLGAIFGGLLTGGIQSYFYGTSASSQRKTELLK